MLRNAYPLRLDANFRWAEDWHVELSEDLGRVHATKETGTSASSSRFNRSDEAWIPVRKLSGERVELGIRDTLIQATHIATIEDASPLVTASLHRFCSRCYTGRWRGRLISIRQKLGSDRTTSGAD
ncbi:MAG: type I-E CRISPR-associated protein Cse1/CasA [Proteobacteria bacterium]|nr:type I-E CRISPR-associated protein Cse1/CasA [Pseudomonadota bacterium]